MAESRYMLQLLLRCIILLMRNYISLCLRALISRSSIRYALYYMSADIYLNVYYKFHTTLYEVCILYIYAIYKFIYSNILIGVLTFQNDRDTVSLSMRGTAVLRYRILVPLGMHLVM